MIQGSQGPPPSRAGNATSIICAVYPGWLSPPSPRFPVEPSVAARAGRRLAGGGLTMRAETVTENGFYLFCDLPHGLCRRSLVLNRLMVSSAGVGAWGGGTAAYFLNAARVRVPITPSRGGGAIYAAALRQQPGNISRSPTHRTCERSGPASSGRRRLGHMFTRAAAVGRGCRPRWGSNTLPSRSNA